MRASIDSGGPASLHAAGFLQFRDQKKSRRNLFMPSGSQIPLNDDFSVDFTQFPEARKAFDLLGTTDFEVVIHSSRNKLRSTHTPQQHFCLVLCWQMVLH